MSYCIFTGETAVDERIPLLSSPGHEEEDEDEEEDSEDKSQEEEEEEEEFIGPRRAPSRRRRGTQQQHSMNPAYVPLRSAEAKQKETNDAHAADKREQNEAQQDSSYEMSYRGTLARAQTYTYTHTHEHITTNTHTHIPFST